MLEPKKLELKKTKTTNQINSFVNKLFEVRDTVHLAHLSASTLSVHLILDNYYKSVIKQVDTFIEAYQGIYEVIYNYNINVQFTKNVDICKYLQDFCKFIKDNRYLAVDKECTGLQAFIDEIELNLFQTLYKLENLK